MRRFVLDTNVLIRAMREPDAARELAAWQRSRAPVIHQHAVVASELLVSAADLTTWRRWHERWVLPFERVRRVIVPAYSTWLRASRIVAGLAERGRMRAGSARPAFFNDCLLAASSVEHAFTLVTHDRRDFGRIAEVEPELRVAAPFP